jgi:lysophospholipase L1-like esterase
VPSWIAAFKPSLVLVSLGVNDGADPQRNNYVEILRQLYATGLSNIAWIEPPADTRFTARLHNLLATLGVRIIPAVTTPLAADGLHPQSYAPWAQAIAQAVAA